MLTKNLISWVRRLCRSTPTKVGRKPVLHLEPLEDRATPSVSPNDLFVASLYQGLLGRPADANGLAYWSGKLTGGTSRVQVAEGIATSPEAFSHDVNLFYEALLNRSADSAGLTFWTGKLESGWTLDNVKAGILGSDEFFSQAGGTNADFLQGVYQYELGGSIDAAGFTYWNNLMNEGLSRTTVAVDILATPVASQVKTTSFYNDTLGRAADAAGLNYWAGQLQAKVSESKVLAGIMGSTEYFTRVEQAAQTPLNDANAAAIQMIENAGLFTGPLPNAEYLALTFNRVPVKPVDFSYLTTGGSNSADNNAGSSSGNTIVSPPIIIVNPSTPTNCPPCVDTSDSNTDDTDTSSGDDNSSDTSTDCGNSDSGDSSDDSGSDYSGNDSGSDDSSFD